MATKIITKNSSTTTAIPTAGDLVQGELAVNVTDKRLFTEDSGGAIVELGTNPSTLTSGAATFSGAITGTVVQSNAGLKIGATSAGDVFTATPLSTGNGVVLGSLNSTLADYEPLRIIGESIQLDYRTGVGTSAAALTIASTGAATFSGNVGIGTAPLTKLHVKSTTDNIVATQVSTASVNALFQSIESAGLAQIGTSGAHAFTLFTANTERMRIDASGNVGIGTSSPNAVTNYTGLTLNNATYGGFIDIENNGTHTFRLLSNTTASYIGTVESDPLVFNTNNTERMRIDASGGIRAGTGSRFLAASTGAATPDYSFASDGSMGMYRAPGSLCFSTGATERMRIDASGNLLVGTTVTPSATQGGFEIRTDAAGGGSTYLYNSSGTYTSVFDQFSFFNGNGIVGKISTNGSATTYATSSDYRLKEDDVPMTGATDRVKALRPINFAWKVDGSRTDGFFAHEAQAVVPECATGSKDAMRDEEYEVTPAVEEVRDEDGNVTTEAVAAVMGTRSVPDYQGIDQSKLVPLLTATIQELIARIEALEGA
jgi:hypothetical protein